MQRALCAVGAVVSLAAALLLVSAAGLPQRAAYTGQIALNQLPIAPEIHAIAPDFELRTLSGSPLRLSDLRGKPVVLNFWATWCSPCIAEMPILQSIFDAQRDTGLRILAINLGESAAAIRAWQQVRGLTYDLLIDEQQQVAALYHLRGQPSTYVISPEGIITTIFFGPVTAGALIAALE